MIVAFVLSFLFADLTGTWKGTIDVQGNPLELTYKLKADGDKLTGTINSTYGELPITDGKINGTDFSYKVEINGNSRESTGKYYGDSIVVTSKFGENEVKNTFKRVAE
jgi:hypothetical protein